MLLNKTVYLEDGGTMLCSYESDSLDLEPLWMTVFVVSVALNLAAIVANILVLMAGFSQKNKSALVVYIIALALSDLLYAMVSPLYTYRYALQYWPELIINFGLAGRLSQAVTLVGNTFSSISAWLVAGLTIDRLIISKFPFRAIKLSTPCRAVVSVIAIALSCCAINGIWMYEFFEVPITVFPCNGYWKIPTEVTKETAEGMVTYIPIRYRKSYQIYAIVSQVLFLYALPTLVMLICNVVVIRQLRQNHFQPAFSGKETNGQREAIVSKQTDRQQTKMIIAVSVIFILSNLPDIATRLLWKFVSPAIVSNVQPIAHLCLMINVTANFVVYAFFNRSLYPEMRRGCQWRCIPSDGTGTPDSVSFDKFEPLGGITVGKGNKEQIGTTA